MVDVYSMVPLPVIYIIGSLMLAAIAWSLIKSAAEADPVMRKKLTKIYFSLFVGSVVLVWGLGYFKVSEILFPSFYEHEELRQQLNEPWDLEDWQSPFNSAEY